MAAKKNSKKAPLKRKVKKPPTKAVKKTAKKAPKATSTTPSEAAPADAPTVEGKQTKTAFVLSFSPETPAKDVVAKGAEQGIALTEKGIYKTRYLARAKGSKAAKPAKTAAPKAAKPAPKAKTPGKRGPGDGSASSFIREQPLSMKASEVVSAAKARGIGLTAGLVYSVRGQMKKSGKAPSTPSGKRRGRPPSVAAKAATPKAVVNVAAGGVGDRERQLVRLALDVGLGRAVELIQSIKSKIDTLY